MRIELRVFRSYKKGKARAIRTIGGNLIKQAKEGNISAAIIYLKMQAGWKENTVLQEAPKAIEIKIVRAKRD